MIYFSKEHYTPLLYTENHKCSPSPFATAYPPSTPLVHTRTRPNPFLNPSLTLLDTSPLRPAGGEGCRQIGVGMGPVVSAHLARVWSEKHTNDARWAGQSPNLPRVD